jgi:hypothetical protein
MLRMSLHRHLPLLVATSSLWVGCGRSLLGDTDTGGSDTDGTSDPSDPSNPSDPSSDPSVATLETTVTDPTVDPTGPEPQPGPPMLVDAVVLDALSVELFFSEPIAGTGGVDPSKFRLSAAFANANYSYGTFYADIGRWNGVEECHMYCYGDGGGPYGEGGGSYGEVGGSESGQYCNEWCYTPPGPTVHVVSVVNTGYVERVVITLDQPITAGVCKQLQQRLEQGADAAAIFLHYSNNGQGVTDLDGEQLEAIAEHWVLLGTQYYSYQPDFFPAMDPFIPIDCPFM